jgi:TPP-dependent trihydroxycyclohexane-1,2-dione (THcHDO) dehydratase
MTAPTTIAQPNGIAGISADFPNNILATVHIRVTAAVPPDTEIRDAVVIKEGTAVSIVAGGTTEGTEAAAAAGAESEAEAAAGSGAGSGAESEAAAAAGTEAAGTEAAAAKIAGPGANTLNEVFTPLEIFTLCSKCYKLKAGQT